MGELHCIKTIHESKVNILVDYYKKYLPITNTNQSTSNINKLSI